MTVSSDILSMLICPPKSPEPGSAQSCEDSKLGILIGLTYKHSVPAFVDPWSAMNPHMLICGMTGSGKTYLATCILMRLLSFSEASAAVIDFTGEYRYVSERFSDACASPESLFSTGQRLYYLGIHQAGESDKVKKASEALDSIATSMRRRRKGNGRPVFIVLDEAWKLLGKSSGLEVIIREGRKYGVGLITSSQLLHDSNSTIVSNAATLFMFRTTDAKSLEAIARIHGLSKEHMSSIKGLERGSCFVVSVRRSGARCAFHVRNVIGIEEIGSVSVLRGKKMEIKIGIREFNALVSSLCTEEEAVKVREGINASKIELADLIRRFVAAGADRRRTLTALRGLGIPYQDLADSFAVALARAGII